MSSNEIKQDSDARQAEKPRFGPPKGNQNSRTHGIYATKTALTHFGSKAIDKRKRPGKEWLAIFATFLSEAVNIPVEALTQEKQLREAKAKLTRVQVADIETMTSELWMVRSIDREIVNLPSLVRKQAGTILPLIEQRNGLLASYEKRRQRFRALIALGEPPKAESTLETMFAL